eukprot:2183370-Prymnesium_polylepis.1
MDESHLGRIRDQWPGAKAPSKAPSITINRQGQPITGGGGGAQLALGRAGRGNLIWYGRQEFCIIRHAAGSSQGVPKVPSERNDIGHVLSLSFGSCTQTERSVIPHGSPVSAPGGCGGADPPPWCARRGT